MRRWLLTLSCLAIAVPMCAEAGTVVKVQAFGAKCDGIADDTHAVRSRSHRFA
jgi:hypothetical protein